MPSFTLLAQSVLSGIFLGGLYGLLGLGLSLSWGLLRLINLAHFALAFLGAYLTYTLSTALRARPLWSLLIVPPAFFGLGVLSQAVFARFGVTQFGSLLVTFGLTVILESLIQWIWTADYRRSRRHTARRPGAPAASSCRRRSCSPSRRRRCSPSSPGRGSASPGWARRSAPARRTPQIAAAFGVNHRRLALVLSGLSAAYAGVAGAFIALIYTLAPAQIYAWIGVVFAAVIIGGLGNPLGPLVAGVVIGVSESLTMALTAPAWAPLVSFTLLILLLLLRPDRV